MRQKYGCNVLLMSGDTQTERTADQRGRRQRQSGLKAGRFRKRHKAFTKAEESAMPGGCSRLPRLPPRITRSNVPPSSTTSRVSLSNDRSQINVPKQENIKSVSL